MAVIARKYNPGFLSDDDLVASFCVRTSEFESMDEMLRQCTGSSNPHQIVIGPRGSGKTSLLLRIAAEVRRDAELSSGFFPIVFAEESYEVATAGDFWLECLSRLAAQAPRQEDTTDLQRTFEDLHAIRDDRTLAERCLVALLDFSDREGKRLVLMVENLNMMFRDMADPDAGWRLRHTLQTEPRIVLIATATSRFAEMDNPDHALYDLFRIRTLRPLDTSECSVLWEMVSGRCPPPKTIRSLEILTGGSPRLLTIVARFGAGLSFGELMADLLDLVDDHTEYFKGHIESLPAQERRVYLALADLWKPATTKEIADRARLETSKCSAQLARLIERGVVQVEGGTARRKQYYLTERLYNIYYLMRRSRGPDPLIEALIHLMESYYSPPELRDLGIRLARDAGSFDTEMQSFHQTALSQLMALPALAGYREELVAMVPKDLAESLGRNSMLLEATKTTVTSVGTDDHRAEASDGDSDEYADRSAAKALFDKAVALSTQNRADEVLAAFDEVVCRFGESDAPTVLELVAKALVGKQVVLGRLNQTEEALVTCDEIVRRFGESETLALLEPVAQALVDKGLALRELNRPEEALAACGEVVRRFGESKAPNLFEPVAIAFITKGVTLTELTRLDEALIAYDEVVRRFGESDAPALSESVAVALVNKGSALIALNRVEEALAACDRAVRRFGESEVPALVGKIAPALVGKGVALGRLNRPEEALAVYDEVVRRFEESDAPALSESVAVALANKGSTLIALNREEEALAACDGAVRRFGENDVPVLLGKVAQTLVDKGIALGRLNRPEEALAVYDEVVRRFGESDTPTVCGLVVQALVNKGISLNALNRPEEAVAAYDDALHQFETCGPPTVLGLVAQVLVDKGVVLDMLNRPEEALTAYEEVVRRFGESEIPALLYPVAKALVGKGTTLIGLKRNEDALGAYDEALRRFGANENPEIRQLIAIVFVNKGFTLIGLNRLEEALAVYDEVVHRFGESRSPELRAMAEWAHLQKAEIELLHRRYETAIETVGRVLDDRPRESSENRMRGHLIRVKATLATGDVSGCEQDIKAILTVLPEIESLPKAVLDALMAFSVDLGPARMRELIKASPSADLLLPLTTALERELGLEPRVAREVEEVAQDIRRDLTKLRETRTDDVE